MERDAVHKALLSLLRQDVRGNFAARLLVQECLELHFGIYKRQIEFEIWKDDITSL